MQTALINGTMVMIEHPCHGCVRVGGTILSIGDYLSSQDLIRINNSPLDYYRVLQEIERQAILQEQCRGGSHG